MAKLKEKPSAKPQRPKKGQNDRVLKFKTENKAKRFWAVKVGRCPGVYSDGERAQQQVDGFPGATIKKYKTREEAEAFLENGTLRAPIKVQGVRARPALSTGAATVKYDRNALPRNFVLGVSRTPGRVKAEPIFGITLASPLAAEAPELPHHRQMRIEAAQAAEQSAAARLDAGTSASGQQNGALHAASSRGAEGRPALELPEDSDDEDAGEGLDAGGAAVAGGSSDDDADASGSQDDVIAIPDVADDNDVMAELDDDFISLGGPVTSTSPAPEDAPGGAADAAAAPAAAIKSTWEDWEHPWYDANQCIQSQSLRLHNEIVGLCQLLKATKEEDHQRHEAIAKVAEVVGAVFPGAELKVFGSFSTGLHLPTSDIDCVIMNAKVAHVAGALTSLGNKLQTLEWVDKLLVIAKAKVPIIKLEVMPVGLKFDISMNVDNGGRAVELVNQYLAEWPTMRPLVTILKLFLLQRSMNEVYTGGLGSYALLISVVAFLQTHKSRTLPLLAEQSLGELMIDYCRLYGRAMSFQDVGVTCADGGMFYVKKEMFDEAWHEHPDRISLMDPLDRTNDVSAGTRNFARIRVALDHAYGMLTMSAPRNVSLLSRILRLDEILMIRPPPPKKRPVVRESQAPDRSHWHGVPTSIQTPWSDRLPPGKRQKR